MVKVCRQCGQEFSRLPSMGARRHCSKACAVQSLRKELPDAFWSKVDKDGAGGCWNWTASRKEKGYGQFFWRGKMHRAHRLAWHLSGHELPGTGLELAHSCDNRVCVNPAHLSVATHRQNLDDMRAKGRFRHRYTPIDQLLYPELSRRVRNGNK